MGKKPEKAKTELKRDEPRNCKKRKKNTEETNYSRKQKQPIFKHTCKGLALKKRKPAAYTLWEVLTKKEHVWQSETEEKQEGK